MAKSAQTAAPATEERYADPSALAEYAAHDGRETITSVVVDASVSEAFDAWLQDVWLGFKKSEASSWPAPEWMGYRDLAPGEGRGLVGHTRLVPLGIVEQIVSAGEPDERDAQLIPSICYKVRKFGPFALKDHIGLVRFVPEPATQGKTRVLWTLKTTPSTLGNVLLCGGAVTRVMLRAALTYLLHALAKTLRERKRSK